MRAVRPRGDDGGERLLLGAEAVQLLLGRQATSASVRPTRPRRHDGGQRLVDGASARRMTAAISAASLTIAQAAHAALHVAQAAAVQAAQPRYSP